MTSCFKIIRIDCKENALKKKKTLVVFFPSEKEQHLLWLERKQTQQKPWLMFVFLQRRNFVGTRSSDIQTREEGKEVGLQTSHLPPLVPRGPQGMGTALTPTPNTSDWSLLRPETCSAWLGPTTPICFPDSDTLLPFLSLSPPLIRHWGKLWLQMSLETCFYISTIEICLILRLNYN